MQDRVSYGLTMFKQYIAKLKKKLIGNTPQKHLELLTVPIVEHCNLRCRFCDHFAPLAEEEFADIKVFEKDFAILSELLNAKVDRIGLMGGEPLLHPQLNDFLHVARKYFPKTELQLVTNGILLLKQTDVFWKACKDYRVTIFNTRYPLPLDFGKMEEVAKKHDVRFKYSRYSGIVLKTSNKIPLDLEGKQDMNANFIKCIHANNFCFLSKGKLFTCTVAPNVRHFNKYFNKNVPLSDADYMDIYKAQNEEEIMLFLSRPIPMCKYCYVKKRTTGHPWQKSKKDIQEWTV
jgi:organic radical activating enzyme